MINGSIIEVNDENEESIKSFIEYGLNEQIVKALAQIGY